MPSKVQTHGNDKSSSGQWSAKPAIDNSDLQMQHTHPTTLSQRARLDPRSLSPRDAFQLQHTIGNRAVGRLLAQAAQHQPGQKSVQRREEKPPETAVAPESLQRKLTFSGGAAIYNPGTNPGITSDVYKRQVSKLEAIEPKVDVREGGTGEAEAHYIANENLSGNITVSPMHHPPESSKGATEFHANIGTMAHEMQHAHDDLTRKVRFRNNNVNVLHTEWRAWAVQAAVTLEHFRSKKPVITPDFNMMKCFKDKVTLSTPGNAFFKKTVFYLVDKKVMTNPSDAEVIDFMRTHSVWLGEALELFYGNVPEGMRLDWENDKTLQGKFDSVQRKDPEDDALQTRKAHPSSAQFQPEPRSSGNNTGLPDGLKSGIEFLSGMSLDNVNVHYNSSQPAQLNALAYTQGSDIHVAPGQERHLPHEAWHVVQQAQGRVQPTMEMKEGVPINDDQGLEGEADVMGGRAEQLNGGMYDARPDPISDAVGRGELSTQERPIGRQFQRRRKNSRSSFAPTVQRLIEGKDRLLLGQYYAAKMKRANADPEAVENKRILEKGLADHDTLPDAYRYVSFAILVKFGDPNQDDDALDIKDNKEVVPDDTELKQSFGYYLNDANVGLLDESVSFTAATNGVNNITKGEDDAFVGTITMTPKSKGGKGVLDVAALYREEAFSDRKADKLLNLVFGVNYKVGLQEGVEKDIQKEVDSVTRWSHFGLTAGGFAWHQWRKANGSSVTIGEIRRVYGSLRPMQKERVQLYETTKATKVPVRRSTRSKTFTFASPVASRLAGKAESVWVHVCDPDAPSLFRVRRTTRTGRRLAPCSTSTSISSESLHENDFGTLPRTVLSGGYEFRSTEKGGDVAKIEFLAMIGHRLDLAMRDTIGKSNPENNSAASLYLPEPNLLFNWEDFLKNNANLFGTDTQESLNLLNGYLQNAPEKPIVRFDMRANVATETDTRFGSTLDAPRPPGRQRWTNSIHLSSRRRTSG